MPSGGITRTAFAATTAALAMLGLAFASVPLYRLFCQVTGFGGTIQRTHAGAAPGQEQLAALNNRSITVRFDANTAADMPWRFHPVRVQETIRIGERKLAFYRATNTSNQPITGTASYNVSPDTAGQYFMKIDCFCFTEQTLQPGQTVDMPLTYFIDPAILDDPDGVKIEEITLSYTFFRSDAPARAPETAN